MGSINSDQTFRADRGTSNGKTKRRVRSGCRTCKIRKIKCDEGRPACSKCVSTGRVCEGYDVWGGGNTLDLVANSALTKKKLLGMVTLESQDERGFVEWFRCRTAVKMQGAFGSPFWETLVIQASVEEPSIFHAMLALSSVHKRVCFGVGEAEWERDPDKLERFTLQQYSKAISHLLQPRCDPKGKKSARVALICCMIFICLEILRGRYITSNAHLQNGIRLLDGLRESRTTTDDSLIEAFTRMNLLAIQFGQGYWVHNALRSPEYERLMITFESVTQARNCLDDLLGSIFNLKQRCRDENFTGSPSHSTQSELEECLVDQQDRIKSDLARWFTTYKASRVNFKIQLGRLSKIAYELLFLHYTMATILADTCLTSAEDEMVFDSYGQSFESIVTHSNTVLEAVQAIHSLDNPVFRSGTELFLFNADIGWTPPLYYTALHCRVHSIRLRAIDLLRVFPSKEGIWDSMFAASVSEEIMKLEEAQCLLSSADKDCNLDLLTLPASGRVHDVEVTLSDSLTGKAILTCKRTKDGASYEIITKGYDIATAQWSGAKISPADREEASMREEDKQVKQPISPGMLLQFGPCERDMGLSPLDLMSF